MSCCAQRSSNAAVPRHLVKGTLSVKGGIFQLFSVGATFGYVLVGASAGVKKISVPTEPGGKNINTGATGARLPGDSRICVTGACHSPVLTNHPHFGRSSESFSRELLRGHLKSGNIVITGI